MGLRARPWVQRLAASEASTASTIGDGEAQGEASGELTEVEFSDLQDEEVLGVCFPTV